jgi:hypothetical protein
MHNQQRKLQPHPHPELLLSEVDLLVNLQVQPTNGRSEHDPISSGKACPSNKLRNWIGSRNLMLTSGQRISTGYLAFHGVASSQSLFYQRTLQLQSKTLVKSYVKSFPNDRHPAIPNNPKLAFMAALFEILVDRWFAIQGMCLH